MPHNVFYYCCCLHRFIYINPWGEEWSYLKCLVNKLMRTVKVIFQVIRMWSTISSLHMGGSWDIRNMNCEPGNQNDWPKETRKKCPLKVIQLPQGRNSVALSLSESAHVPMHVSQINRPVVSDSLWPRGLQHARLPCPSPIPRACSNSCLLSRWCHPTSSSSVIPFSSCLQSYPASGSQESVLHIRWPKYWSFSCSISPSNEYPHVLYSFCS